MSDFKILQGIPMFQAVSASMADSFTIGHHLLFHKNLNVIKYQLCGLWNDEIVRKKHDNKIKILGSCEWFLKKLQGITLF